MDIKEMAEKIYEIGKKYPDLKEEDIRELGMFSYSLARNCQKEILEQEKEKQPK